MTTLFIQRLGISFNQFTGAFSRVSMPSLGRFINWMYSVFHSAPKTNHLHEAIFLVESKKTKYTSQKEEILDAVAAVSGEMSQELKDVIATDIAKQRGLVGELFDLKQFEKDIHRMCSRTSHVTIDGKELKYDDPAIRAAFEEQTRIKDYDKFFTRTAASRLHNVTRDSDWTEAAEAFLIQNAFADSAGMLELHDKMPEGLSISAKNGEGSLPRKWEIEFNRDQSGNIENAVCKLQIELQVLDPDVNSRLVPDKVVARIPTRAQFVLKQASDGKFYVDEGVRKYGTIEFTQSYEQHFDAEYHSELSSIASDYGSDIEEVQDRIYGRAHSLSDAIYRNILWGANALTGGALEQRMSGEALRELEVVIDTGYKQTRDQWQEHIEQMRNLYRSTGNEAYKRIALKLGLQLAQYEVDSLDDNLERALYDIWKKEYKNADKEGDIPMFIRDNRTRALADMSVWFPGIVSLDSTDDIYSDVKMGQERSFYTRLSRNLKRFQGDDIDSRQILQLLMTQATVMAPIHALMLKLAPAYSVTDLKGYKGDIKIKMLGNDRIEFSMQNTMHVYDNKLQADAGTLQIAMDLELVRDRKRWKLIRSDRSLDLREPNRRPNFVRSLS